MATEGMIKFDEYLTRRLLGFPSVVEYYHSLSSKDRLDKINIPLFCMNSKDDPILSFHGIPIYDCLLNKNIILMITNSGGHVGWFEGFFRPKRVKFVKYFLKFSGTLNLQSNSLTKISKIIRQDRTS